MGQSESDLTVVLYEADDPDGGYVMRWSAAPDWLLPGPGDLIQVYDADWLVQQRHFVPDEQRLELYAERAAEGGDEH